MTVLRNPFKGKFIAFYQRELLSEYILDYIICKALCGLMTPDAAKLVLIPDTRHGQVSVSGLRTIGEKLGIDKKTKRMKIGRTRRKDCTTLKQQITQYRKTEQKPKLGKKRSKNSNENKPLKTTKSGSGTYPLGRHFLPKKGAA
jgi:hypothetical protein